MLRLLTQIQTLPRSHVATAAAAASFRCRAMTTESETTESDAAALEPAEQGKLSKQKQTDPGSHRDMRRAFYVEAVVDKLMNQMMGHPYRMWTETRAEWYRVLSTRQGCRVLLRNNFLSLLHTQIRERELNATRRYGSHLICLGRSLDEHRLIKKELYRYKYLALCEAAKDGETPATAAAAKLS